MTILPSPADKLLAMLEEGSPVPEGCQPRDVERLPLNVVVARLHELGVDPTMPDRLRNLVGGRRGPADHLLSLMDEGDDLSESNVEQRPLPEVVVALKQLGIDHTAGIERIRETVTIHMVNAYPEDVAALAVIDDYETVAAHVASAPAEAASGRVAAQAATTVETTVPQRLDRLPWTVFHTCLLLTLGASWAVVGLQVALVVILKQSLENGLGLADKDWVLALVFSLLGTALGAVAFGRLADRLGRRFVYVAGLSLIALAVGAVLTPFSGHAWTLALFRFVAGVGIGGEYVAMNATVQEFMPPRVRGRACLAAYASFWLGSAAAALGSVLLFDGLGTAVGLDGWRVAFAISATLCIVVLFLRRWIPESPRWLVTRGREEEAEDIVAGIEGSVPDGTVLAPVVGSVKLDTRRSRPTVWEVWRIMWSREGGQRGRTLLCFSLMTAQALFYNAFFFGHVDVLQRSLAADKLKPLAVDEAQIGWHMLAIALGNFLGPVLLGRLVDRKEDGRRRTMAEAFLASGVLLALTAVAFAFAGGEGDRLAGNVEAACFTAAWTLIFFFASTAASTAYLAAGELVPLEIRGLAFALVFAASMLVGGVLSPQVFNLIVDAGSRQVIAAVYLSTAALMAAVAPTVAPVAVAVAPVKPRRFSRGFAQSWRLSSRTFPELSGRPLEEFVPNLSATRDVTN